MADVRRGPAAQSPLQFFGCLDNQAARLFTTQSHDAECSKKCNTLQFEGILAAATDTLCENPAAAAGRGSATYQRISTPCVAASCKSMKGCGLRANKAGAAARQRSAQRPINVGGCADQLLQAAAGCGASAFTSHACPLAAQ